MPLPKSRDKRRTKANQEVFDFESRERHIERLDSAGVYRPRIDI